MELIGALLLAVFTIVGAAVSIQLSAEFKVWVPWITERLIERAVQNLPPDQRERFAEEWRSHVNDIPGEIGKLVVALGLLPASRKMAFNLDHGYEWGWFAEIVKRTSDIVIGLALLFFTLPATALTTLAILLEDGRPIFYRQERVGLNGRIFSVLKFRTLRVDPENEGIPRWAAINDSRVTTVGAFIRKMRIDEIPQIYSVLRGDMSFIGPRPELPSVVADLAREIPFYQYRHIVKPGIIGWAQVNQPYGASLKDARQRLTHDLYYLKNRSLILEFTILIRVLRIVLFPIPKEREFIRKIWLKLWPYRD
ncbi:sugar transferase [Rhodospirillaceae bacterium SYSU D60014]|uniref:sugar transferase n=1 Tax=Virgifigura deserti TaxID=2268457 RepID=UPI000E66AD4D